jgi:DUF4097 and DUF4098 domain-containing protein YvlB
MQKSFKTPEPTKLHVEIGKGTVTVEAAEGLTESTVEVTGEYADDVTVEQQGDRISVRAPKVRVGFFSGDSALTVRVSVPAESELHVRTGSADITATGRWSATDLRSGSGDVQVERIESHAIIETGSGDIGVRGVLGDLRIKSGSGDVHIAEAGASVVVATGSGNIEVGQAAGPTAVKTGSGDLRVTASDGDVTMATGSGDAIIERLNRGRVSVKGSSGDVAVGIPEGVPVWTDIFSVSGRVRSDLVGVGAPAEGQDHIELRAKTVSGDITLKQL